MMNYKTPGVYVEELSLLPPSVVQVATAIPAFIGYTEFAKDTSGSSLLNTPKRIKSLLEYEVLFGGAALQKLTVTLQDTEPFSPLSVGFTDGETERVAYRMHHALRLYFENGGGPCYIIAVGIFGQDSEDRILDGIEDYQELKAGLDAARKIDEITLIVFPDADQVSDTARFDLYRDTLMQCADLQDRFGIFDVMDEDKDGGNFRNNIGTNNLSYAAAYYPFLNTSIPEAYNSSTVVFEHGAADMFDGFSINDLDWLSEALQFKGLIAEAKTAAEKANADSDALGPAKKSEKLGILSTAMEAAKKAYQNGLKAKDMIDYQALLDSSDPLLTKIDEIDDAGDKITNNESISNSNTIAEIDDAIDELLEAAGHAETSVDAIIEHINAATEIPNTQNTNIGKFYTNSLLAQIKNILSGFRVKMPPSAAIAGVYAQTDRNRGVWKSPANVSLNMVLGPSVKIDNSENDDFNVHSTGKSINVIRSFTGKGTLVWGARTLDGNSNEWKYVSVRRFFNMVEESVKEASEQFVFEPNNANTWIKVKAMIENFLLLQWRAGALMGSKPEQAFFVKIGLGQTMTQDDVLNGKMIVEIGLAVVRPAEFIILRFSHKMLEA